MSTGSLRDRLLQVYEGGDEHSASLRWGLIGVDIVLVLFFVVTSFFEQSRWLVMTDFAIGAVLAAEFATRILVSRDRIGFLLQPMTALELVVILSLFAPALSGNFVFLRVLRAVRLFRSYHMLRQLRSEVKFFAEHEAIIHSATNLLVFVFVVSAAVYALQQHVNPQIQNYVDALYFTITTLTTTGFGDIVMVGPWGRMLAVLIMIIGVSLFLRLIQAIFRPSRIEYECPDCGLDRHEPDAVHCRHCGRLLHIRTHGDSV